MTSAEALEKAVDKFMDAYRQKYRNPAMRGIRANAPMRAEFAELNSAMCDYRAAEHTKTKS